MSRGVLALSLGPALEVVAYPKPGNVHRLRDHPDKGLVDFIASSHVLHMAAREAYESGARGLGGLGRLIYVAVDLSLRLTRGSNTCLGTATLILPLAYALGSVEARGRVDGSRGLALEATRLLREASSVDDAVWFYEAIRRAMPSYTRWCRPRGRLPDLWAEDYAVKLKRLRATLWDVLVESSRWDLVSRECVSGYPGSLHVASVIRGLLGEGWGWNEAVVYAYVELLSRRPDSLVARKHGEEAALRVVEMAKAALEDDWSEGVPSSVWRMDEELQLRGWNPGATADIVAAGISLYMFNEVTSG